MSASEFAVQSRSVIHLAQSQYNYGDAIGDTLKVAPNGDDDFLQNPQWVL